MAETTPPSREVRLAEGITVGPLEDLLYRSNTGSTSELFHFIVEGELIIERLRSEAVESFAEHLLKKMGSEGYLTVDSIKQELETWHEAEVLGYQMEFEE